VRDKIARSWFGLTALVVLVGLIMQLVVTARITGGVFSSPAARVANVFCYFTILSNVIVGVTSLLLALRPDRPSPVFRIARLDGLIGIAVTGVVYHVALASLYELQGYAALSDQLLHTVSPLLCVIGWLLFGPRSAGETATGLTTVPAITPSVALWSLAYPLLWLGLTLIRGAITDFYPYPFLDAHIHGYALVALNCVLIGVLFVGLAFGAMLVDRLILRLDRRPVTAG
jgi:hypothetical protein